MNSVSVERPLLRARSAFLLLSTVLCSGLAVPAFAQDTPTPSKPILDSNGVDLATGTLTVQSKSVAIGDLEFNNVWSGKVDDTTFTNLVFQDALSINAVVYIEGRSLRFVRDNGGVFQPEIADGSKLTTGDDGAVTYTNAAGTRYEYVPYAVGATPAFGNQMAVLNGTYSRLKKIVYANGETRTWNYRVGQSSTGCEPGPRGIPGPNCTVTTYQRPQSITTNTGMMLKTTFASNTPGPDFNKLTAVTAINSAVDYCDPDADQCSGLTQAWPTLSISQTTDNTGLVQKVFSTPSGEFLARLNANGPVAVNRDNAGNSDFNVTYYPDGRVHQVTGAGVTTTYAYAQSGNLLTVTRTKPNNIVDTFVIDTTATNVSWITDAANKTTSYEYDSAKRLKKTIYPEGDQLIYEYDSLGRITETRRKAKPGSSLADIVTTSGYENNCTVETLKYCMKPLWTVDALGNRTDYTYSADHAEATMVRLPAPSSGQARPQIDYTYTPLYAKIKNASGTLVDAPSPVWKLTGVSRCATAATCAGSADQQVTTIAYGTAPGGINLLPTQVTVAAGNGSLSATTSYAYDNADNIVSVDGPLPGAADTNYYFWDADKRLIGTIGPDPDGSGPLKRRATRYTYAGENLVSTSVGTATGTDSADLAAMTVLQTLASTYDANDYKLTDTLQAGGINYALTQYSYDEQGRLECQAVRMNAAAFGSLPSSACTLGTPGSAGPDRIGKVTYDALDRAIKVQSAYGTADQADEVSSTYTDNGKVATATDAQGNRTTYQYDGVDRLIATQYPVAAVGANASSTTDFEQYFYDANSNIVSRRLRDGSSIGYSYDALNRLITKNLPGSELDVTYGYDLLGRPVLAATAAQTLSFTYDALNRNLTQSGPLGTVTSAYDIAGRRTRLTWPDAFYLTYDYLVTGEMTAIRESGAVSGVGVLAAFGYDDLGQRISLTRGNGVVTSYTPDAVSRLSALTHSFPNSPASNITSTFSYNPAGQIASVTRSNDAYAWTAGTNRNDASTANGLNQILTVGAGNLGYDARGNLTSTGTNSYSYSSENLLTGTNLGVSLAYDPLNRLFRYTTASYETDTLYDGSAALADLDNTGRVSFRYVWGPRADELLVTYLGANTATRRFWSADERGSIIAASNAGGASTGVFAYDEYGVPSADTPRFGYTGQRWLTALGLSYYKARMYSTRLGRFLQTDPIGYADGMNWYNYVGGDPVNKVDPRGLNACTELGLFTATSGYSFASSSNEDGSLNYTIVAPVCGGAMPGFSTGPSFGGGGFGGFGGFGGGGGSGPVAPPPEPQNKPQYCSSSLYKIGNSIDNVGKVGRLVGITGVTAGLGAAAIGGVATAPAGGGGAAPGLALAAASGRVYAISGFISTGGNLLKAAAGDEMAAGSIVIDSFSALLGPLSNIGPIGSVITGSSAEALTNAIQPKDPCG